MSLSHFECVERLCLSHADIGQCNVQLCDEWAPDSPPITIQLASIGRVVAAHAEEYTSDELNRIFAVVEESFVLGDHNVKTSITTGLLEAILSAASSGECEFKRIAPFLGAQSKQYCREWDQFTGFQTPGL